ncbi:unnamed protein product [Rhizoctonia solani]|uniref:Uncharacterized protein n=1 Tax=Rhizoctonia solani TaxID=456999 RepID=A0A8H3CFU6_9AGAM|nr:unnamed protein product [Rhizoctonia solani]
MPSPASTVQSEGASGLESLDSLVPLPDGNNEVEQLSPSDLFFQGLKSSLSNIPRGITFDATVLPDVTSLILSHYIKVARESLFKAESFPVEEGLLRRISDSSVTRWSMYLGARIINDLWSDNNLKKYLNWIFRFSQQITQTPSSNEQEPSLRSRLAGLYDLIYFGSLIAGTASGYSLLRSSTPALLQLAALYPQIWVDNTSISIPETFRISQYEIMQFVVHDTIASLVLGIPPILQYNTSSPWVDKAPGHYMEWIYGFPLRLLILLAEVNAWRTSRMMGRIAQSQSHYRNVMGRLESWNPIVDHTDEPHNDITRLAIQEAWRQATLIYMYMGMCEVNSADPRVEKAVQQIVHLGNTITTGSTLERHIFLPCLIAGIAARREKHRATLRGKIVGGLSRKVRPLILPVRSSDFLAVLDYLWHGVGSGGRPVVWEDYVKSRCAALLLHN